MTALASILAGPVATFTAAPSPNITPLQRFPIYYPTFTYIGIIAAIIAVIMLFSKKYLAKIISEKSPCEH